MALDGNCLRSVTEPVLGRLLTWPRPLIELITDYGSRIADCGLSRREEGDWLVGCDSVWAHTGGEHLSVPLRGVHALQG